MVQSTLHAIGELRPIRVQATLPPRGIPAEKPELVIGIWAVAAAFLTPLPALARLLQVQISHQVTSKRRAARLLDVQEHDDVRPLDVKVEVGLDEFVEGEFVVVLDGLQPLFDQGVRQESEGPTEVVRYDMFEAELAPAWVA